MRTPHASSLSITNDQWWFFFDTPNSPVNIFTQALAEEVLSVTERARVEGPEALIFVSRKERSYLNGAQLMLASAIRDPAEIFPMTRLLRETYEAVRQLESLTVAAVEGTCYGCGVEFTLHCDLRVASDAKNTHFYMTELVDYLDTPAFGSTQLLPKLMPLTDAVDFLMWGRRLFAEQARQTGLVDAVLPHNDFAAALSTFLLQWPGTPAQATRTGAGELSQETIASLVEALPEPLGSLHNDCFELLLRGHQRPDLDDSDRQAELRVCGASLVRPEASRARSVFFVRHLAERSGLLHPPASVPVDLLISDLTEATCLHRALRHLPGSVLPLHTMEDRREEALFISLTPPQISTGIGGPLEPAPEDLPFLWHEPCPDLKKWDPARRRPRGGSTGLVELASPDGTTETTEVQHLFALCANLDLTVLFTRPGEGFASDQIALAFLRPLLTFSHHGGDLQAALGSLHAFGYVQHPGELAAYVHPDALEGPLHQPLQDLLRDAPSGLRPGNAQADEVVPAILLESIFVSHRLLENDSIHHLSVADIVHTELTGFPIAKGTLFQFATPEKLGSLMSQADQIRPLVHPDALLLAETLIAKGVGFYG